MLAWWWVKAPAVAAVKAPGRHHMQAAQRDPARQQEGAAQDAAPVSEHMPLRQGVHPSAKSEASRLDSPATLDILARLRVCYSCYSCFSISMLNGMLFAFAS